MGFRKICTTLVFRSKQGRKGGKQSATKKKKGYKMIIDIVGTVIGYVAVLGTLGMQIWGRATNHRNVKELIGIQAADNAKQEKSLSVIADQIQEINGYLAERPFAVEIIKEINDIQKALLLNRNDIPDSVKEAIVLAIKYIGESVEYASILGYFNDDTNFDCDDITQQLRANIKTIRLSFSPKEQRELGAYLDGLSTTLNGNIDSLALELKDIMINKTNGERKEAFKSEIKNFVKSNIIDSITQYNNRAK